jgi:polysaccharide export outer membrane protein
MIIDEYKFLFGILIRIYSSLSALNTLRMVLESVGQEQIAMFDKCFKLLYRHPSQTLRNRWLGMIGFAAMFLPVTSAIGAPLPAHTKIRLSVLQWMPTKGVYEQWGAFGGEYVVSDANTVTIPVLGSIDVGDLDNQELASEIAKRLKDRIGLVEVPATTVEIIDYSPIYVVGDVAKPGEYKFSTGLTVLQALAMSGGEAKPTGALQSSMDVTRLVGDLKELDDATTRSTAKIGRLEAEMSGAKVLDFSKQLANADPFTTAVYRQEQIIFEARANALERKSKSLLELRDLLDEEIRVLEEKTKSMDANIKSIQQQVDSTTMLVAKGALVATRQAEVERDLRSDQNNRLDITTSIMRARQSVSETTRDLQALSDERLTEVASELQAERATLVQLKVKRETSQKLMIDNLSAMSYAPRPGEKRAITFNIVRRQDGNVDEIGASETSTLMPGDVVKVVQSPAGGSASENQTLTSSVSPRREEASQ